MPSTEHELVYAARGLHKSAKQFFDTPDTPFEEFGGHEIILMLTHAAASTFAFEPDMTPRDKALVMRGIMNGLAGYSAASHRLQAQMADILRATHEDEREPTKTEQQALEKNATMLQNLHETSGGLGRAYTALKSQETIAAYKGRPGIDEEMETAEEAQALATTKAIMADITMELVRIWAAMDAIVLRDAKASHDSAKDMTSSFLSSLTKKQ